MNGYISLEIDTEALMGYVDKMFSSTGIPVRYYLTEDEAASSSLTLQSPLSAFTETP